MLHTHSSNHIPFVILPIDYFILTKLHFFPVCQNDLEVGNATVNTSLDWWEVGKKNQATCFDNYLFVSANTTTRDVECTFDGWEVTDGCQKGEVMVVVVVVVIV